MLYLDKCQEDSSALVFSWSFDELKGHLTPDASKNNFTGKLGSLFDDHALFFRIPQRLRNFALPAATPGAMGKGQALKFDGTNWVHAGNSKCFTQDRFTLVLWAYKDKSLTPVEGEWLVPTLAAKSAWPANGWWLCTKPNTNDLDMAISWGAGRQHIHSGFTFVPETWHHIAVTMDNLEHEIQFFIDGKPYGEKHTNVPTWLTNWDQNLYVGEYDGTARWPWLGRIDNVHFYNSELTADEIHSIYTREGGKL